MKLSESVLPPDLEAAVGLWITLFPATYRDQIAITGVRLSRKGAPAEEVDLIDIRVSVKRDGTGKWAAVEPQEPPQGGKKP